MTNLSTYSTAFDEKVLLKFINFNSFITIQNSNCSQSDILQKKQIIFTMMQDLKLFHLLIMTAITFMNKSIETKVFDTFATFSIPMMKE